MSAWKPLRALASAGMALLLVASLSAQPERNGYRWTQEWSGDAEAAERIEVRSRGLVAVRGTDREGVRYKLTTHARSGRGTAWVPVVFDKSGITAHRPADDTVALTLRDPVCNDCRVEFVLEMEVPAKTAIVDIETRGGGIDIRGISGSVTAHAFGGSIMIDRIKGAVTATTAGGNVHLGTIDGAVYCETAGGSIDLVRAGDTARLITSAGSIRAHSVAGDLRAETGGGSIEIGLVEGMVRAKTGGGLIRVVEARNGMQAEAGAGDIRVEKARGTLVLSSGAGDIIAGLQEGANLGDSELTTSVGSIVLSLPGTLALTLDASIELARGLQGIFSDFPTVQVRRSQGRFGPAAEEAAGAINGGGSVVRIRNGLGRIEIRRTR